MNIIYLISCIAILACFFLIKKTDKELNGITWIVFTICLFLSFNLLLVFILHYIFIPCNLFVLSIINILISVLFIFFSYNKKKKLLIQKYFFRKGEIIAFALLIIFCSFIGVFRFNNFKGITYETTDPAVHYKSALTFSEADSLLDEENGYDEMYRSFSGGMTGSYINGGLFIKALSFLPSYVAFMIFDVFSLVVSCLLFFVTINEVRNKNKGIVLTTILSLLYVTAYPLNDMIFGFFYLGIGVMYINFSLLAIKLFIVDNVIKNKYIGLFIISLVNYAVFFSYYLFVPCVYFGIGIYYIYRFIKKNDAFKEMIVNFLISLIIPFVIGVLYFLLPGIIEPEVVSKSSALAMEGYIYRNLWSNFILFIPMILFSVVMQFRQKKIGHIFLITIATLIFAGLLFIMGMKGLASSYYYYKIYYVLWLLCLLNIAYLFSSEDKNIVLFSNISFFMILFVLFIAGTKLESKIMEKNSNFNSQIVANQLTDIYVWNAYKVLFNSQVLTDDELLLLDESNNYNQQCVYNKEFPVVGNFLQLIWSYSLTGNVPKINHIQYDLGELYDESFDIKVWENDPNHKCLIVFNSYDKIKINYDKYKVLYQNDSGFILEK